MKKTIINWCDNVYRYGFYKVTSDKNGAIKFENDKADFESEAEFNATLTAFVACDDIHKRYRKEV